MARPTLNNAKRKMISFRATEELSAALEQFANDIDADSTTEALTKAIEYGILYYYYTMDQT